SSSTMAPTIYTKINCFDRLGSSPPVKPACVSPRSQLSYIVRFRRAQSVPNRSTDAVYAAPRFLQHPFLRIERSTTTSTILWESSGLARDNA
ncbi:MAG TPA: hypothetical protein VIY28_17255, partial [Pseudonocardiaceae bacterium]